ncbi:MAG: M23 family metallopeptidase [Actinobacteria bacterium]|nr:M23 family metallopeptidase [Actinomycetota bacterium]
MVEPVTIVKISLTAASFIKKYWHIVLILLFIIALIPTLILTIAINILFPQASKEEFEIYKELTEDSGIYWASFLAYNVVRLKNYLKDNNPNESVFDLLKVSFIEYEIIEKERQVTKIINGIEVTETVIEKEYVVLRELELHGYFEVKELLGSLNYNTSEDNMRVNKVSGFLEDLNEEEEYEIEIMILTDEEIAENFDDNYKQWFFALVEIIPLLDPSSEFDPDEFIFADIITNPDIPSIWPSSGSVTSEFGEVRITGIHRGIDIANVTGTVIKAAANGTVIAFGTSGNYGKRIMVYHGTDNKGNTYVTVYAHLSEFKVRVGDMVSQGDLIGLMGNTGYSTGTHLHYEVVVNGIKVNPRYFLQ